LEIDKIEILAENTMVGLWLFEGGEAFGRVLVLSTKFEFLGRRNQILLSL
jgi:hypothetical protein